MKATENTIQYGLANPKQTRSPVPLSRRIRTRLATFRERLFFASGVLALALGQAKSPAPKENPRQVIDKTTTVITEILRDQKLGDQKKQEKVMEVVDKRVHFETICKLVLAKSWRKFSADQRKRFIAEFRRHLLLTYWNQATTFDFERVEITKDRKEKRNDWTVQTLVYTPGDSSKVDYRLRLMGADEKNPGEWKIIDIIIEEISLVSTFRSEFKSVISNRGAEGLLKQLKEKNDKEAGGSTK